MTNDRLNIPDGDLHGGIRPLNERLEPSLGDSGLGESRLGEPTQQAHHDAGYPSHDAGGRLPPVNPYAHKSPRGPASRLLGIAGYAGLAIVCLALMVATFLFVAEPADIIRDQMISRVKQATGRDLLINGKTSFTVFPSIGIAMSDVSLSPPPGMGGKPTITMNRLDARLKLVPLFSRRIVVERLVLRKPVIDLRVDRQGRKSWNFASVASRAIRASLDRPKQIRLAQVRKPNHATDALPLELRDFVAGSDAARSDRSPLAALAGLSLDDVRIVGGALAYNDEREGVRQKLDAINVKLALRDIASPLSVSGNVVWRGEKINLATTVQSLRDLLSNRQTDLSVKLASRPADASYNGTITLGDTATLRGRIALNSNSVRRAASWVGTDLPPSRGFGPLKVDGFLSFQGNRIDVTKAKLELDGAAATGSVGLTTVRARPLLRADLKVSLLDLNKYMTAAGAVSRKAAGSRGTNPRSLTGSAAGGRPQVRGFTKRKSTGWNREQIDSSALGLIDVDARLSLGRLLFQDIKVGRSRLVVRLNAGRLVANLRDVQLYGGNGKAVIEVKQRRNGASLSANVSLTNISALPLLRDAAQFERIDGRGNLKFVVTGHGASEHQIVSSLLGDGKFTFTNGAIIGINVARMLRGLQSGQLSGLKNASSDKTDFSELSATFQVTNGIIANNDFRLTSPLLRLTGAGKVSLPPRTLNYKLRPKLVATLKGQGGQAGLSGLEIPVLVRGSWDNPKYSLDYKALTSNPDAVVKTIRNLSKKFKGKKPKDVLDGLLGGKNGGKAKSFLNKFLR